MTGRISSTGLYRKPTAGNTILHASSSHPQSLIMSITYSQYLRLRRNCSADEEFWLESNSLRNRLLERGYSPTCLKKAFRGAHGHLRQDLLFSHKKHNIGTPIIRLITTYKKQHKAFRKIIEKHWHVLQIDPSLKLHIPNSPAITYKRTRSLKDQLVKSEYVSTFRSDPCKRLGTFTCGGCSFCRYMNTQPNVILPNGKSHKPKHYANCKTAGVIYCFTCQCQSFYVGKTKLEFCRRAARHISSMTSVNPDAMLEIAIKTELLAYSLVF